MLRRLQVADEIVVLERRYGKDEDMETHSHERDERQTTTRSAQHKSMIRTTPKESKRAHDGQTLWVSASWSLTRARDSRPYTSRGSCRTRTRGNRAKRRSISFKYVSSCAFRDR